MKNRSNFGYLIYLVALFLLFSWVSNAFGLGMDNLSYSQIVDLFENEQVKSFVVQGEQIELTLHTPVDGEDKLVCVLGDPEVFQADLGELIREQNQSGILVSYNFLPADQIQPMDFVMPLLISGGILLFVYLLVMTRANGNNHLNNFGKARTVIGIPDGRKVNFNDVAGADEEKQELQEVVDFLRDPEKFRKIGARIPHGMLLVGPPGTGKTLLARACAGEAGVQFLSISGSDFVELYVGVGASRVRDLFDQAKKRAPAIVFID